MAVSIWRAMCGNGQNPGMTRMNKGASCAAALGATVRYFARAAYRNDNDPDDRYNSYGFRVVVRRPPSR